MGNIMEAILTKDNNALKRAVVEDVEAYISRHEKELARLAAPKVDELSAEERASLEAVGVYRDQQFSFTPLTSAAAERRSLINTALSTKEAANLLGISEGRIRQRIGEGTLYAIRAGDGKSWLLPSWQFLSSGELPGLKVVLKAMPDDLNMMDIYGFFTTPQPDLEDEDGEAMSPLDWLTNHQDPSEVAELAKDQ